MNNEARVAPERSTSGVFTHSGIHQDFQTVREWMSDYCAKITLTGEDELIDSVAAALRKPIWQPYLGRRAFPIDCPMVE
jgi:CRISPR-associated protein (Cas_Cas5)